MNRRSGDAGSAAELAGGEESCHRSIASRNSAYSIASVDSFLSIGSSNSFLSIGSVGSTASAFSVGSAGSFGGIFSFASRDSAFSSRSRGGLFASGANEDDVATITRLFAPAAALLAVAVVAWRLLRREPA